MEEGETVGGLVGEGVVDAGEDGVGNGGGVGSLFRLGASSP